MWKVKRLLTEEEMDHYLHLRDTKGDKAASKYMSTLQDQLYEEIPDENLEKTHAK